MKEIAGARIVENREVARGTRWMVFEAEDELPDVYAPGHIVALYVPDPAGRWVRHPYSVSWADGPRIGVLYRVIPHGRTSPFMAMMQPGETLRLGGSFGEPVARLVGDAPALVGVCTGTGLGPLRGFALRHAGERPTTLLAGFRERVDVPFAEEMAGLAAAHRTFSWRPTLSRPDAAWDGLRGRVTAHLGAVAVPGAHWHVVGNGAMVADVRAGLLAAGVAPARVTTETYFDGSASPDPTVVARIAAALG
ncbi:MAG: ferredoxin--NADP reductase [Myxococcota bacterium]